jgi:hypothetical protein
LGWAALWDIFLQKNIEGCQMVCFQTKNPNSGTFWRALEWKMLVYFMVFWNILRSFGTYILWPFGNVVVIWYTFPRIGISCQEKSGNPDLVTPVQAVRTFDGKVFPLCHHAPILIGH